MSDEQMMNIKQDLAVVNLLGSKTLDTDALILEGGRELKASVKSLWATMPDKVNFIIGAEDDIYLVGELATDKNNHVLEMKTFLESIGKTVSFTKIQKVENQDYLNISVDAEEVKFQSGYRQNAITHLALPRFDESVCNIVCSMTRNRYDPVKEGLIGAKETGQIRNLYLLGADASFSESQEFSFINYARALANKTDGLVPQPYEVKLKVMFSSIAQALSGHFDPKEIIIYEGHFTDHLWGRDEGLYPEALGKEFKDAFPNATIRIKENTAQNASYGKYEISLPDVQYFKKAYLDPNPKIIIYDRHAWGIFNDCPLSDQHKADTWYYNPVSSGSNILLQLPSENLLGSLLTAAMTDEARQIFSNAGLTTPYSEEEVTRHTLNILRGIAQKWNIERSVQIN